MPSRAVDEESYQRVATVLAAEAQPGDVVLLDPWWSERARIFVPATIPVVGYLGSDQDDLELHSRIWVLSQPRMGAAFTTLNPPIGATREFGNLTLRLFENRRFRLKRWDARDVLASARVFVEGPDGARSDCHWDGRAHRCANGAEVATEFHEVKFAPHACIKFFPPGGTAKLVAEFTNVPAAGALALRAGLISDRSVFHMPELTPVDLGLQINSAPAGALTIPVGVERMLRAEGPEIPAGATVQVWSRSANPAYRDLCIELFGLEKSGE